IILLTSLLLLLALAWMLHGQPFAESEVATLPIKLQIEPMADDQIIDNENSFVSIAGHDIRTRAEVENQKKSMRITFGKEESLLERQSLKADRVSDDDMPEYLFTALIAEYLGILAEDHFFAKIQNGDDLPYSAKISSPVNPLLLQRNRRGTGYFAEIKHETLESSLDPDSWKFKSSDTPEPIKRSLENALNSIRHTDSPEKLESHFDLLSFIKCHIFLTLTGKHPATNTSLTLFKDDIRTQWEWTVNDSGFKEGSELDGSANMLYDDFSRYFFRSLPLIELKNSLLTELLTQTQIPDSWDLMLQKWNLNIDSSECKRILRTWGKRRNAILAGLSDSKAVLSDPKKTDEGLYELYLTISGSSEIKIETIAAKSNDAEKLNLIVDSNMNGIPDQEDHRCEKTLNGDTVVFQINQWFHPRYLFPYNRYTIETSKQKYKLFLTNPVSELLLEAKNHLESSSNSNLLPKLNAQDFQTLYSGEHRKGMPHSRLIRLFPQLLNRKVLQLGPGELMLNKSLYVQPDQDLLIYPGTTLLLDEGVSIVADGQIYSLGEQDKPIYIKPASPDKPWGAIVVRSRQLGLGPSKFSYTSISGGSNHSDSGILYTGAMSVYNADSQLDHVEFFENTKDDAINVRYSDTVLNNCSFVKNKGDAVDYDFSSGEIVNSFFDENRDDAIDISFSEIRISNNDISKSGDKGISVGEKSMPIITQNVVRGCNIGIAVKDLSEAYVESCKFMNNNTGIALYQKKSEFGRSYIDLVKPEFSQNGVDIDR
ncbi:MAG: right-handed parallel beta-helix repeat-containing protein, partial [Candidatus Omnitrophica bacterium]|nr:right-handed parallel beta-helix repeat-containing protein [Candidatus Omnitrophota bacterium]